MTLAIEGRTYTRERVRYLLSEYQRYAQNARLPERAETLSTGPALGLDGTPTAPRTATATMYADLEYALSGVPLRWVLITLDALSKGNSDWCHGMQAYYRLKGRYQRLGQSHKHAPVTWYEIVGEWWGIEPAYVARIVDLTVDAVVGELNT
jgi:hypothetical protein